MNGTVEEQLIQIRYALFDFSEWNTVSTEMIEFQSYSVLVMRKINFANALTHSVQLKNWAKNDSFAAWQLGQLESICTHLINCLVNLRRDFDNENEQAVPKETFFNSVPKQWVIKLNEIYNWINYILLGEEIKNPEDDIEKNKLPLFKFLLSREKKWVSYDTIRMAEIRTGQDTSIHKYLRLLNDENLAKLGFELEIDHKNTRVRLLDQRSQPRVDLKDLTEVFPNWPTSQVKLFLEMSDRISKYELPLFRFLFAEGTWVHFEAIRNSFEYDEWIDRNDGRYESIATRIFSDTSEYLKNIDIPSEFFHIFELEIDEGNEQIRLVNCV